MKLFNSPKYKYALITILLLSSISMATDSKRLFNITKNMEIFAQAYRAVNKHYAEPTDPNQLMRTAIDSMLADFDPYTNFFSESQMEQLRINIKGGWDGIGIKVKKRERGIVITEVIEGSPAGEQGVHVGDLLLKVDGKAIGEEKVEDIEKSLHGKVGTIVNIDVQAYGKTTKESLALERANIREKNVPYYDMLDDKTAYIVLTTFSERASANIAAALKELKSKHNPKQLILDLRDNGGGLLIEAVNICNLFVNRGENIVTTRNKVKEWDHSFGTRNEPMDLDIPLIVLINGRSASASEIVSGAIQDLDRGILVGRKSFGKGLVQNTKDISYNSKMKFTTAKYYIPSGRCIQALDYVHGKGMITPDSLIKEYKTKNGRKVYDGGGLLPDVKVEIEKNNSFVKNLVKEQAVFDFASFYRSQHDSIVDARSFSINDAEYNKFVEFVQKGNYNIHTDVYKEVQDFKRNALKNNEYASLKTDIQQLEKELLNQEAQYFQTDKDAIIKLLNLEIINRYYFKKGRIEHQLSKDKDILKAIALFNDASAFKALLQAK